MVGHLGDFGSDMDLFEEYWEDMQGEERAWSAAKQVEIIPAPYLTLSLLREDPSFIYRLTPDEVEDFLCDRLDAMGFEVAKIGRANMPDGGVDIVACSRTPTAFPFLLAVQMKHHRKPTITNGPAPVRELQSVVLTHHFNAGLLVTSTTFTPDAVWWAKQLPNIVRLRDITDLRRWIYDNFISDQDWRDVPASILLRPGLEVQVPGK